MSRPPRRFALSHDLRDLLRKDAQAHKYRHGHALVMTGGAGRTGAARLAARGALRIGAGLVTLAAPPEAAPEVACQITAIMLRVIGDADALGDLLKDARFNALCLGPGFGTGPVQADMLRITLAAGRPMVLDADALTLLSTDAGLLRALHPSCVLTPHDAEFARIFPDLAPGLSGSLDARVAAIDHAAARIGCPVVLKGPATLVADPQGRSTVHPAADDGALAWLATAGSGDVLAGFITGLLARGVSPRVAADMAIDLHRRAARELGPGLIAEDLPEALPAVFRAIGL